jgi:3-oxoacyl-[acyl-carrier protein] reductase
VSGRCVLVTGSSRGIGRAIAERFATDGDRVAVHHRSSPGAAAEVAASLAGAGHTVVQADLADAEAVRQMVDAAASALEGIDVLVNNAATFDEHPIAEVSYAQWQEAWRRTIDVNLIGAANVTYCVVRHMLARGERGERGVGGASEGPRRTGGRIVNVSSRGAFRGEPRVPAYGASKAGLNALGQSLAQALAPHGISVATVAPGFVQTDMAAEHLSGPGGDAIRAQSPFGRVARPDEVAAAVFYLASAEAEWTSGAILDINGASYLRT